MATPPLFRQGHRNSPARVFPSMRIGQHTSKVTFTARQGHSPACMHIAQHTCKVSLARAFFCIRIAQHTGKVSLARAFFCIRIAQHTGKVSLTA